jgi:hypothetical protein
MAYSASGAYPVSNTGNYPEYAVFFQEQLGLPDVSLDKPMTGAKRIQPGDSLEYITEVFIAAIGFLYSNSFYAGPFCSLANPKSSQSEKLHPAPLVLIASTSTTSMLPCDGILPTCQPAGERQWSYSNTGL